MFRLGKSADREVVRRVLSGRQDQFEELVRRHMPMAQAIAMSRLRNPQDAEDAVQESFLKAYRGLNTLREQNQFGAWLAVIVRNTCNSVGRKNSEVTEPISDSVAGRETLPAQIERNETRRLVRTRLDQLEESDREILLLHYFAGNSTRDIADLLQITRDAVKKRLQRAREALGRELLRDIEPRTDELNRRDKQARAIIAAIPLGATPWTALASTGAAAAVGVGAVAKIIGAIATVALALGTIPFAVGGCDEWNGSKTAGNQDRGDTQTTDAIDVTSTEPTVSIAAIPETGDGAIAGSVRLEKTKEFVSGATVVLDTGGFQRYRENTKPGRTARTTDSGLFQFDRLPAGSYTLRVEAPNTFSFSKQMEVESSSSQTLDVELEQMAAISGRVLDKETGMGVAGVRVYTDSELETTSGDDGSYTLSSLRSGKHRIYRGAIGQYAHMIEGEDKRIQVESGDSIGGIDFPLSEGITIFGSVLDENDQPVPDFTLRYGLINMSLQLNVTSDEDGRFELPNIPKRWGVWYDLDSPSREQGMTLPDDKNFQSGVEDMMDVVIRPVLGAVISGHVVTSNGTGVAGAVIKNAGKTDANGAFTSPPIYPGTYTLSMEIPAQGGYAASPPHELETITLRPGEKRTGLRYIYDPEAGLSIAGHIFDSEGNALEGVSFAVMSEQHQTRATTDKNGAFFINGLQDHIYQIAYFDYGGRTYYEGERVPAGTQDVEIRLNLESAPKPGGPIVGRVVDAQTGEPVKSFGYDLREGIYVELDPAAVNRTGFWDLSVPLAHQVTDKDGAFSFSTYASGPHSLLVMASGYAPYTGVVEAGSSGVVIALELGARVEGLVLDASGQPVADAIIIRGALESFHLIGTLEPNRANVLAVSGRDGTFRIDNFGRDVLLWSAVHPEHGIVSQTVTPSLEKDNVVFEFPPTGGLRGVITIGETPGVRCGLEFNDPALGVRGNFLGDEAGNYSVAGLSQGEYSVTFTVTIASNGNYASWQKIVDSHIPTGEPIELDVDFPEATSTLTGVVTLNGQPISAVSNVRIDYPALNIAGSRDVDIKPDGTYRIDRLPSGDAVIRFPESWEGVQFDHNEISIYIPENAVLEYDVVLQSR
ncbi:MAG: sigma-70 family RNA polymerase sigma factor [Candidatus Hydrogenedentes bacterium]|nr:sigma-70 family RNA polymerase sigma factor [Candidatus Hydrogenedentota bacterium]